MMERSQMPNPEGNTNHERNNDEAPPHSTEFRPSSITRPDDLLLIYYVIISALTLIFFPFVFLPLYFKYETLEYEFDETGISMKWGILFRKEVNLTYRRIQDIHVTRDIIQRWLGLSTLSVQTASGSATPEMSIVGIKNPDVIRDYLYGKMRGIEDNNPTPQPDTSTLVSNQVAGNQNDESLRLLIEIRDAIRQLAPIPVPDSNNHAESTSTDNDSNESIISESSS